MLTTYVIWNDRKHEWCEGRAFNDETYMSRVLEQKDYGNTISLSPMCQTVFIDIKFERNKWEKDIVQAGMLCDLAHQNGKECVLKLWYVPNARMDRVKSKTESFTLRTYCRMVNAMDFDKVIILDPHSDVTPALLDRCTVIDGSDFRKCAVGQVIRETGNAPLIVYPDAGAEHKYGNAKNGEFIVGFKTRDWETSYVTGYTLTEPEKMKGRPVIIFDDIVAHGYTMKFLIDEIEKHEHGEIYICIPHLEEAYFDIGTPLKDYGRAGKFKLITTDSISHDGLLEIRDYTIDDYITELKLDDLYPDRMVVQ